MQVEDNDLVVLQVKMDKEIADRIALIGGCCDCEPDHDREQDAIEKDSQWEVEEAKEKPRRSGVRWGRKAA